MRKLFIISCVLLLCLCETGCVRVNALLVDKHRNFPPPYRFYFGTRSLIGLPVSMSLMEIASHGHRSSNTFNTVLPIALFVVDFPLEVVLDTVLLPVDLGIYAAYCINPPLDKYLVSNDLKGLEEKLKKGVSPNVISPWFLKNQPLLYQAYLNHNEEAFELLLNYGAKVPIELLQVEANLDDYTYRILQRVFRNGCPKELQRPTEDELRTGSNAVNYRNEQLKGCFSYWILKYLMDKDHASPNDKLLVDVMVLLLENGFSPNDWENMRGELHFSSSNWNPLDVVMANMAMNSAEKERLITAMRKHGAQTYRESINLPPSESIPPMFQPFMDAIAQIHIDPYSSHFSPTSSFRYSDTYPGVEGPVLVIDIPFIRNLPDNQKEVLFRKSIPYHRRVSATEWNPKREYLEVPEKCRIVLTPLGKRLPSRRPQGIPTQRGFWEAWLTLPTCEMYIEYAKDEYKWFGRQCVRDENRDMLQKLIYASAKAKTELMENLKLPDEEVQAGSPLDTLPWDENQDHGYMHAYVEREFAPLLDELGKLPGVNSPVTALKFNNGLGLGLSSVYVFSMMHRDMRKIFIDDLPLVPHPEEVLVVMGWKHDYHAQDTWAELKSLQAHSHQGILPEEMPPSLEKLKMVFDFPWGKEGKNYWNWRVCIKKWDNTSLRRHIYLFYGDSVSEERLATIRDICERFSPYQR